MGTEARYSASITKTCDGCGERWESHQSFRTISAVLAFGGPEEASQWKIHITADGAQLLCDTCVEHLKGAPS